MKNIYLLFICITIFLLNGFAQKPNDICFNNINCDDFNLLVETKEALLIDVSMHKEYRKKRLINATLASSRESLVYILKNINNNTFIMVYCDEGDRSQTASQIICQELKFKHVYNLKGGIKEWEKRGYPVDYSQINRKTNN